MSTQGLTEVIARQDWLEPVEHALHEALHKVYGVAGHGVKNFLHGTWLGHPLHVVLTDVPIGSWTAAMVLDAVDSARGRREFERGADALIAIGLGGAALAAITGLTDWEHTDPPARRIGLVHGLLNTAGTALFATSLIKRRKRDRAAGRAFALAGFGIALGAAWLGAHLVYSQKIGVDHTAGQKLPEDFVPVLPVNELLPDQPRKVEANGVPVVLVRRVGHIYALVETCAHLGGPLAEGRLTDDGIECPWHKSTYALEDGRVLEGPSQHPQPCFDTRVRNGQIEVRKATGRPLTIGAA